VDDFRHAKAWGHVWAPPGRGVRAVKRWKSLDRPRLRSLEREIAVLRALLATHFTPTRLCQKNRTLLQLLWDLV